MSAKNYELKNSTGKGGFGVGMAQWGQIYCFMQAL